jgi:hypothetical protein
VSGPTAEVAPKGATCPTCGLDVGGYAIGQTRDGRTTWDRPFGRYAGPTGTLFPSGGLTHVEGGERCTPSAGAVVA